MVGAEVPTSPPTAAEVARLPARDNAASLPEDRRATHGPWVREPLLERVPLSGEFLAPLMAAADLDPSFCALCAFGRRRVAAALLNYLRTGTDPI